ncbi:hypothetical protein SAMN04489761_2754 [Tenacibaculum sp. MAR_2009_124]|uniref:hypothetical protein n=1 Tax=Tenacibaculum sp. MAR_2009_124 TaxID=1250059 RepID=UPI0008975542|nr:hypothetical protein [Tenacibaculum sp. MAR_2009_124]SEC35264.1 hypothetical protein SAMN04489761_2754 [Tenacibaculum sp. MAR_2009_124]
MLNFFRKKKDEKNKLDHPDYLILVEKWDEFLSKIETRFQESLIHAEEALLESLVDSNYDINPTLNAWSGIKSQLMGLGDKVENTFEKKVKPQMLNYIEEWDAIDEAQKGTILNESIYSRIERYQIVLEGKISKRFYDHAITFLNENFNCTQCGAELEVKKDIFRSHYVSCSYCNTVNTFIPSDKIAQIRWVVDNIVRYTVIAEWDALQNEVRNYKKMPSKADHEDKSELLVAFKRREQKERTYWERYMEERYQLLPEYKETFKHDVEVKMKHVYEERKREFDL